MHVLGLLLPAPLFRVRTLSESSLDPSGARRILTMEVRSGI